MLLFRRYFDTLVSALDRSFVSLLVGPRQVGKSTLMHQLKTHCVQQGKRVAYFNLEDPRDLQFFVGSESDILSKLETQADVLFIDEFHYLKNATKLFKVMVDAGSGIKIVASGSSALEIHKHLKESLAGRYRKTQIYPLLLSELEGADLSTYLTFGGMPGLLHEGHMNDKLALLNNIIQSYLLKDVKSLIKEENIRAFNHLLYLLAQSQGSVVSVAGFAREVGLTEPAIRRYLDILVQTYVCYALDSYAGNLANELKKAKKYYLFDLGVRHALLSDFSPMWTRVDSGVICETYVMHAIQAQLQPNMSLKFWRTRQGEEVDFVVLKNRVPYPIEVKAEFTGCTCPKGLASFLTKYPQAPEGLIVTRQAGPSFEVQGRPVSVVAFPDVERLPFLSNPT